MHKKHLFSFTVLILCALILFGCAPAAQPIESEPQNKVFSDLPTVIRPQITKQAQYIAEPAVSYDSFAELTGAADLVLVADITAIEPYMTDYDTLYSRYTLSPVDTFKGAPPETLEYHAMGGVIGQRDHFIALNTNGYIPKDGDPGYEESLAAIDPDELLEIEVSFIANPRVGHRMLLFLELDNDNTYRLVGTAEFGLFFLDPEAKTVYRSVGGKREAEMPYADAAAEIQGVD